MNILSAAVLILKESGSAMHVKELTRQMISEGLWKSGGKTPESTVGACIYTDIKKTEAVLPLKRSLRRLLRLTLLPALKRVRMMPL